VDSSGAAANNKQNQKDDQHQYTTQLLKQAERIANCLQPTSLKFQSVRKGVNVQEVSG